jgi:SAM-dependent methyltransferase
MGIDSRQAEIRIQDGVARHYEGQRYRSPVARAYHLWWSEMMVRALPAGGRWLDLGCGTGWTLEALRHLGLDRRVLGVDISFGMLAYARRKGMPVALGDVGALPVASASIDVVLARGVLHHLEDLPGALAEIHRVLRPGGLMVAAEPNRSAFRRLGALVPRRDRHFSDLHGDFSPREIQAAMKPYFRIEDLRYFGWLAYPFSFPDVADFGRRLRLTTRGIQRLIRLDEKLCRLPGIRSLSWALLVQARRAA